MSCDTDVKSKFIITKLLSFHIFLSFTVGSFSSSLAHLRVSIVLTLNVSKNDKKSEIGKKRLSEVEVRIVWVNRWVRNNKMKYTYIFKLRDVKGATMSYIIGPWY